MLHFIAFRSAKECFNRTFAERKATIGQSLQRGTATCFVYQISIRHAKAQHQNLRASCSLSCRPEQGRMDCRSIENTGFRWMSGRMDQVHWCVRSSGNRGVFLFRPMKNRNIENGRTSGSCTRLRNHSLARRARIGIESFGDLCPQLNHEPQSQTV